MRLLPLLLTGLLLIPGCGKNPEAQEKKKIEKEVKDLGDPNAPLEIRALQGAKQVKKDIEEKQKEEKKTLEERD